MLPFDRMSPRTKAGLAVALALLLWAPQGISEETTPVVTGHSTFYNGDVYDQCLASIAGILRSRVMWFNDQVLVERYPGKGNFVFVTEAGAPDPTAVPHFYYEGVTYEFKDPNGAKWIVYEAYYSVPAHWANAGQDPRQPSNVGVEVTQDKLYVWFVEIADEPIIDQFPGADRHSVYNFLVLVDTCKFHRWDDVRGPVVKHENASVLNEDYGHENGAGNHTHESWNAHLWVGKRPVLLDEPETEDNSIQAGSWVGYDEDPGRPDSSRPQSPT